MGIWKKGVVVVLFLISGIFYYNFVGNVVLEKQEVFVSRVLDGDTIEILVGEAELKARLKGINTPEKGMVGWEGARGFLQRRIENKSVEVVNFGGDKYERLLVYVFDPGSEKSVNEEILGWGLGGLYYYGEDDYYDDMKKFEEFARVNELGIWKKSVDAGCVELVELQHNEPEKLVLKNICNKDIKVVIKDDATHIYHETLKARKVWEKNFSHIWNTDGDSLFVWDDLGAGGGGGDYSGGKGSGAGGGGGLLVFYRY